MTKDIALELDFPVKKIRKRNGYLADFNFQKIANAIYKAFLANERDEMDEAVRVGRLVLKKIQEKFKEQIPGVEDIQDLVEGALLELGHLDIARDYIAYRTQHAALREVEHLINSDDLMEGYLGQIDWTVRENSNMAFSLQGLNNHVNSAIASRYWLNKVYTQEISDAHTKGDLHLHDLGCLAAYCCGWDLKDLLTRGFGGVAGKIDCRASKHLPAALGQVVNFFFTLQGEAAGAQAFSNFDTYMAPYVRYDNLNYNQVKQGIQSFVYNLNVPTRVGFQTPFTNITMDLIPPRDMVDQPALVGSKVQDFTYGDLQEEMNMINQAFTEVMSEGDGSGRVFTFPIPTYNITKGFDWDNPRWRGLWEMTAKFGIPYFSNFINSDMDPSDARSMCCRLRLDNRELRHRGGGLFGANPLTGSIGVVTINMPRIGYLSNNKDEFFERLDRVMELARKSLEIKRKVLENFTASGLYPYSKVYLTGIKERLGQYWKNHFNTIGLVGMNEALLNILGCGIAEKEGKEFALETLDFMRSKITKFQEEGDNMYNLEATPGEGVSHRLARLDRGKYPQIIVANNEACNKGDSPYYSNSTQLPVDYTDDLFEALESQDELQAKYTGGTVLHGFLGEAISDAETAKNLVRKIAENFKLPYYTLTPTFSICAQHGYLKGQVEKCPQCGKETEIYSRVVGYLRPVKQWHDGKQAEFAMRKTYKV